MAARLCSLSTTTLFVRGIEGEAPLVAVVRIDNDTERLRQQIRDLSRRIDDLHHHLVDIAEASVEALIHR